MTVPESPTQLPHEQPGRDRTKGAAISRVLDIIEAVSEAQRPPSPADLAFLLDIPKPSIQRRLQQLQAKGDVQIDSRPLQCMIHRTLTDPDAFTGNRQDRTGHR